MNQYFVVEFAHSVHGRVKTLRVTYKSIFYLFGSLAILCLLAFGLFSSYMRMSWKAAQYNQLLADLDHLRSRYRELQQSSRQRTEQMATLQNLASEVSVAYGVNRPADSVPVGTSPASSNPLIPSVKESIEEYNFLKSASFSTIFQRYPRKWQTHVEPSLWPVDGVLRSPFGGRPDPLSGEGAFHTGVDLSAVTGTPVKVTADGIVSSTNWSGRYGKLVIVDHGNGVQTYYAHLAQFLVLPGQDVRMGQVLALSGGTGRVTSPHLHYEVRIGGTPVNPYKYLAKPNVMVAAAEPVHSDLGL